MIHKSKKEYQLSLHSILIVENIHSISCSNVVQNLVHRLMLDHAKEAIQDCPSKKNKEDDDKESKKGNQDVENDME